MSKLARACAVAVAVATSLAGGIAAAQIQGGAARKTAPPAIALGVPVTKATISQRSSSSSTSGSGSSLSFESGQPALRYQAVDLPAAKDPVRREAVKDGAKEVHVSARGAAATGARDTREFAPAPGVLRANMPPVSFADAQSVLKTRVLPANVNQGVTAMPSAPKAGKTSTSTSTATSFAKISGDAAASGPASIAELARALRNHPDLIYQYVRNNIEYYPTFGLQKGALGAVLDNQATAHDQAALMVELLRASGFEANRAVLKFNAAGKAETYTEPSGVQAKFTYSGNDLTQVQNSLGRTLTFTNSSGRISKVSDATRSVSFGYDASSNLATFTNTLGQATTFSYAQPGQIRSIYNPASPTTATLTNTYDTLGRVKNQVNARGKSYDYYFAGSRTEEVGPGGVARTSYLDGQGNVIQSSTPAGHWTTHTYDGQSRLIRKQLPEGNATEYAYDDASCTNSTFRCTHNVKSITSIAKPGSGLANRVQRFYYESAFNKIETAYDARNQLTRYTYTARGLPLTITAPVDAAGVAPQTTYTYTAFTPSGYPSFYLPSSQTVKTSASNSVVTATTYNAANKYVPQTSTVDAGAGQLNLATSFTYDAIGNLTGVDGPRTDVADTIAIVYDTERRPTQLTDAMGKKTGMFYDADGRLVRSVAQHGSEWQVNCKRYSPTGKVLREWGPAQMSSFAYCPNDVAPLPITDTAYDDLDRPFRITQHLAASEGGNRVTETVYNLDDTVQAVNKAVGTALAQTYASYTYTPNGNVDSVKDAKNNLTVHTYDGFDRLARTYYPLPATPLYANANDYEENGYAYDANGNLTGDGTWSYGYDLDNRLKTASKAGIAATLSYDAEGRLRQTVIGASTTNLLYDATNLIAEYDAAGTTLQRRYVHGPGTDEPIVWYEGSGTTARNWCYADHLGSIVATANATGASTGIYSYGPYGEPNTTTGPRFRYTGQQLIGDLGLYHYKARFYSPGLGRFLQTDPIGYKDDVNLYAYVGNNPANRTDPSGLIAREAVELAAGVGGAISDGWSASVAAFQNESLGDVALKTLEGLNPTVGAAMGAGVRLIGAAKGAQSIADGPQLARQLAHSEAASIFVNGGLRPEIIAGSKVAIPGSQLNNPSLVKNLTADGSNIADWAKMSTQTFNSPSGPFQVHFYQNLATGATHFADDFKAVFNHNGAWP